jgi:hypothetical protein
LRRDGGSPTSAAVGINLRLEPSRGRRIPPGGGRAGCHRRTTGRSWLGTPGTRHTPPNHGRHGPGGPRANRHVTAWPCSIALKIGLWSRRPYPVSRPATPPLPPLTYQQRCLSASKRKNASGNSKPQLSATLQCVLLHTQASGSASRTASGCLSPALCHVQSSSALAYFVLPCSAANSSPFGDPKRAFRAGRPGISLSGIRGTASLPTLSIRDPTDHPANSPCRFIFTPILLFLTFLSGALAGR